MPSHIFISLGLWPDAIQSNLAARAAAQRQGDIGEELHAMDYLMYAELQAGRLTDAQQLLAELRNMQGLPAADYKVAYAATIMPIRFAIERRQWDEAMKISAGPDVPPQFRAITEWANSVAASHAGNIPEAELHFRALQGLLAQTRQSADEYWSTQVQIQASQTEGWLEHARGNDQQAATLLRAAADQEDHFAKRPITPGPVTPAREQLADLLLETNQPVAALREYESSLQKTPGRRNGLAGAALSAELSGDSAKAKQFTLQLQGLH